MYHSPLDVGLAVSREMICNSIILALVELSLFLVVSIAAGMRTVEGARRQPPHLSGL